MLSEAIRRKKDESKISPNTPHLTLFSRNEGSSTVSAAEPEFDFPLIAGRVFIDCMIESLIDLIPAIKAHYYEGLYNKLQMCLLSRRRNAFLPDIREYVIKVLLEPLDKNSKLYSKLKSNDITKLEIKILPKIMLSISNIEKFDSKSLDLMFLNMMNHLLQMEDFLKEFKRGVRASKKPKKKKKVKNVTVVSVETVSEDKSTHPEEGGNKSDDEKFIKRYNYDSIALCQVIHYFYAKYEKRYHFYKDKDPEIYNMLNYMNKFLTFYDAKYLKSLSIIRDVFRSPEKTYLKFYEGWKVIRDLLIKINGYRTTI